MTFYFYILGTKNWPILGTPFVAAKWNEFFLYRFSPCILLHIPYDLAKQDSLLFPTHSLCSELLCLRCTYTLKCPCTYANLHQGEIPAAVSPEASPAPESGVGSPSTLCLQSCYPLLSLPHLGIGKIYFKNTYH